MLLETGSEPPVTSIPETDPEKEGQGLHSLRREWRRFICACEPSRSIIADTIRILLFIAFQFNGFNNLSFLSTHLFRQDFSQKV